MMKKYNQSGEINHNPNWSYICDHPYRISIIDVLGSGKTNVLLNLIKRLNNQILTKFIYTSKNHLNQSINYLLIIENLKHPKAFIDYSQTTDDVYENLEDYNPTKKRRVLIVVVDMIADMDLIKS